MNAILLLVLLPFLRSLGRDPEVMGEYALGRALTGAALGLVAMSVAALAVLTVV